MKFTTEIFTRGDGALLTPEQVSFIQHKHFNKQQVRDTYWFPADVVYVLQNTIFKYLDWVAEGYPAQELFARGSAKLGSQQGLFGDEMIFTKFAANEKYIVFDSVYALRDPNNKLFHRNTGMDNFLRKRCADMLGGSLYMRELGVNTEQIIKDSLKYKDSPRKPTDDASQQVIQSSKGVDI